MHNSEASSYNGLVVESYDLKFYNITSNVVFTDIARFQNFVIDSPLRS